MLDFHDPVSSLSHLIMAAWAVVAALILTRLTLGQSPGRRLAIAGYGASMVFLYLASGLFHGLNYENLQTLPVFHGYDQKELFYLFRNIDRSAIFLLIDGSFAPPFVYLLLGRTRVACFAAMGTLTVVGLAALWLLPDLPHAATVGVYFGLGLVGMIPVRSYLRKLGWPGAKWILALAVAFTIGAVCEAANWPVIVPGWFGSHEILHISDMAGTLIHFIFVVRFLVAPNMKRAEPESDHQSATKWADAHSSSEREGVRS
ncbi:hemolysin III family protein [Fimbriiglobus ruber]|uniref:Hemolysin III family channel protein n=1 Tax=Fimbriiglobus ruber TaxID=1908690 RepID=A0A225DQL2_9BACT|nr:hemolysin III family protein [Fimbriiglobus ruber]OWK43760.1 hemolysin III family channel protein [Fimbriiglobus ruber]